MKFLLASFTIILAATFMFGLARSAAAEDVFQDVCTSAPTSAACQDKNNVDATNPDKNPLFGPNGILTTIVNVIGIMVGVAAVVSIIVAGVKFITSGSNPQEVSNARELVIYALVALVVVAFSQILVRFFLNKVF